MRDEHIPEIRILGEDPGLRERAREVGRGADLSALTERMRTAMTAHDGIGIAAPQIGEPLRIFLVAKDLLSPEAQTRLPSDVFVNPRILKRNFKREKMEEGCLSVPRVFGEVSRRSHITVEAYDAAWRKFRIAAQGLLARVFQHEFDHLEGILFVEKAKPETLHEVLLDGTVQPWKLTK